MLPRPTVAKSVSFPLKLWQEMGALHFGMSQFARNGNLVRDLVRDLVRGLTLVASLATPLLAQEPDTSIFRIGEIVVQAARPITTTGGAAALEIRMDSAHMAAAPTLDQLLRSIPLVQVRTNSRGEAQFSLRGSGSDAREVAVLVDGMPLSLGWDDRADLSVLPTTAVHTLTVARGLPSLLYGPNVLGGVVEVGVARGASIALNPRSLRIDAGIDNTGSQAFSTAITLPMQTGGGELLLRAGGGYRGREGVALASDVVEPVPGEDADLRVNTALVHRDAFAAARLQTRHGTWASLTASGYSAQRGIPAELHIESARYWRYPRLRRGLAVLAAGTGERASPFGGVGDVEASIGIDAGHTEIDQYDTRAYQNVVASEDSDDHNISMRMRADQTLGGRAELGSAFTYADIRHDELLTPGGAASYRQRLWSIGSELSLRIARNGSRISAGAAYDGANTPESGDKPPLGTLHSWGARAGVTSLVVDGRVLLHAGASRRSRFPALRELYSGALGRFEPNPSLRPENLVAAEAGGTLRFTRGELQAVAFRHVLSDAIVRVSVPGRKFKRVNRDRQSSNGLELLANVAAGAATLGADLTWQSSVLEDAQGQESEPEYQPTLLAGMSLTAPMPWQLRLDTRVRYVGRQSCINAETAARTSLAASGRVDAELGRAWPIRAGWMTRLEAAAAVDNAGDTTVYDQCGLPQPGRTLRLQVRVR